MKVLGKTIKDARIAKGWSLSKLRGKMDNKASVIFLYNIESFEKIPSLPVLESIAEALELDREKLINIVKDMKIKNYQLLMDIKYGGIDHTAKKGE